MGYREQDKKTQRRTNIANDENWQKFHKNYFFGKKPIASYILANSKLDKFYLYCPEDSISYSESLMQTIFHSV